MKRLGNFSGFFSKYVNFSQEDIRSISNNFVEEIEAYEQKYPRHGKIKVGYETEADIYEIEIDTKKSPIRKVYIYTGDRNVYIELDCWNPDCIKAELNYTSDNRNDKAEYDGLVKLLEKHFPQKPEEDDFGEDF